MRVGWLMLTVGLRPRPAEQNNATINELGSKVLMVALWVQSKEFPLLFLVHS